MTDSEYYKLVELERDIQDWIDNYRPRSEWKAKKFGKNQSWTMTHCMNCDAADPHMRPICWNCGALMKQFMKNENNEWVYGYPDEEYIIKFYGEGGKKMKVYIVTEGSYSDYHIDSVFTNKEQAELRVATLELQGSYDCPDISEWDTDTIHYDGQLVSAWIITYNCYSGEITDSEETRVIKGTIAKEYPEVKTGDKDIRVNATRHMKIVAETRDKAKKIFYDLFAQACYKAYEEQGKRVVEELTKENKA